MCGHLHQCSGIDITLIISKLWLVVTVLTPSWSPWFLHKWKAATDYSFLPICHRCALGQESLDRSEWTKEKEKKKKKSTKEEWGCLGLSHDFWYDRQTVLLGFNHLRVFWCVCFYCCLTEKAFWKGWITFALFHFCFSSLQLFSVTPSFISYKKKLYRRHYWKTLKNYSAHFSRVQ